MTVRKWFSHRIRAKAAGGEKEKKISGGPCSLSRGGI